MPEISRGGTEIGGDKIKTLSAANEVVEEGYYKPTTLAAIDGDLVTGSIKSGINLFGVAGHTDVRNVSDGDAVLANVQTGKTFYAVGGARKTGNIPLVTLSPDSEAVPAGIHPARNLSDIDADLAVGNIKAGVTIFGKVGAFTEGSYVLGNNPMAVLNLVSRRVFVGVEAYQNAFRIYDIGAIFNGEILRIKFDLASSTALGTAYGLIHNDAVSVGTERSRTSTSYQTFTEDIDGTWQTNDDVFLKLKISNDLYYAHSRLLGIYGANEIGTMECYYETYDP